MQNALYSRVIDTLQVKTKTKQQKKEQITMIPCTVRFALALSDPFNINARGACVPLGTTATYKTHAFARFDVVTTATPTYILITPSLANNSPTAYYTSTGSVSTVASPLASANTLNVGWNRLFHNGPFTAAQVSSGAAAGRVVSTGVRIQYTGALTSESGLFYCYHDPLHANISGVSISDLGAFTQAEIGAVSRIPCSHVVHPVNAAEANFQAVDQVAGGSQYTTTMCYPFSNGQTSMNTAYNVTGFTDTQNGIIVGYPVGVIAVSGIAAGVTLHVELISHMEYIGTAASPSSTEVTPDISGTDKVIKAALAIPVMRQDDPIRDRTMWSYMYESLQAVWHDIKPVVVPSVVSAISAILL